MKVSGDVSITKNNRPWANGSFVSLRRTPPVNHVFCVVSNIFEIADFKFRCSKVQIPAVFSEFAKQNSFQHHSFDAILAR